MTHQPKLAYVPATADAGREVAHLRHVLGLVDQIAGRGRGAADADQALNEGADITVAYDNAMPILQRRFDALAGETAAWAAAGIEALLGSEDTEPSRAAAEQLALELDRSLRELTRMLRA
jgi:hypothetical protein